MPCERRLHHKRAGDCPATVGEDLMDVAGCTTEFHANQAAAWPAFTGFMVLLKIDFSCRRPIEIAGGRIASPNWLSDTNKTSENTEATYAPRAMKPG